MEHRIDKLHWAWRTALLLFVVAASTGVLFRFSLAYGWTAGLNPVNVRHAHSHLMYFGWVTPVLFLLIAAGMPRQSGAAGSNGIRWVLIGCFAASIVSYPLFLAFGYGLVAVGTARMPISVIGSTLNMGAWWGFVVWYVRSTRGEERDLGRVLVDVSLVFLVLATLGAMGLAFLKPLGIQSDVWSAALTHIFVDFFSEGWFVVGLLGVAHRLTASTPARKGHWSVYLLCLGLPLTFAMGMPSMLVPPALGGLARVGGILVSIGLLANVVLLWPATATPGRSLWRVPLVLLALKSAAQLTGSVTPGVWWADVHGMRILYLHLMLLGFVTLGLFAAVAGVLGTEATKGRGWVYLAVLGVLATLVPLTPLWPSAWGGRWAYELAAWMSAAPVIAVAAVALRFGGAPPPDSSLADGGGRKSAESGLDQHLAKHRQVPLHDLDRRGA